MIRALVRPVPAALVRATSLHPPPSRIDVERARAEHAAYVTALRQAGATPVTVPVADDQPDSVFVEDQAVVRRGRAVLCRSGHPGRRAESPAVAETLARFLDVVPLEAPAMLDGGDVLALPDRLLVGISARTNPAGAAALGRALDVDVVPIELPRSALHLKSLCSALGDRILLAEGALRADLLAPHGPILLVPRAEAFAANVVVVGAHALVAAGAPITSERVAAAGYRPIAVDTPELRKADGSLTCLSVLF